VLDSEVLTTQLSQHGYKLTRQRRAVVDVVSRDNTRLTAADVFDKAHQTCPDLGLTTVYRTLELLEELGTIRRVHLEDGCEAFAPTAIEHGHYLICSSCQTTIEFEGCDLSALLQRVADRTGFTIEQHWLELVGQCPKCQKKGRR
jgi:Fur family ferric uptake transcriptional regulator